MNKENIIKNLKLIFVALLLFIGINYVSALDFKEPNSWNPTASNTSSIINTSANPQVKDGALSVDAFQVFAKSIFDNNVYFKGILIGDIPSSAATTSDIIVGPNANNSYNSLKLNGNLSVDGKLVLNNSNGGSSQIVPLCADPYGNLVPSSSGCASTPPPVSGNVCETGVGGHCYITIHFNRMGSPTVPTGPSGAPDNWNVYQAGIQVKFNNQTIYLNQGGSNPTITQTLDVGTTWMSSDPDKHINISFYGCDSGSASCSSGASFIGWSCQVYKHPMSFYGPVDILKINDRNVSDTGAMGLSCSDFPGFGFYDSALSSVDMNVSPSENRELYFNW